MTTSVDTKKNFTTTLPETVLRQIDDAARDLAVSKNDIIVRSFALWNKKRTQDALAASYARMGIAAKKEMVAIADEGLSDWDKQIPA